MDAAPSGGGLSPSLDKACASPLLPEKKPDTPSFFGRKELLAPVHRPDRLHRPPYEGVTLRTGVTPLCKTCTPDDIARL